MSYGAFIRRSCVKCYATVEQCKQMQLITIEAMDSLINILRRCLLRSKSRPVRSARCYYYGSGYNGLQLGQWLNERTDAQ